MSALGNVGTGNLTTVRIKEEPSLAGTISSGTYVDLRRNRAFFQRLNNVVESDYANAVSDGIAKEVFRTTSGMLTCELDPIFIGWLLKWFVGVKEAPVHTGTEYKHVFKPGITSLKSCKVQQNIGGLGTPFYNDFIGQAIDRLAIISNILDTVKLETVWVGIDDIAGADAGTPSPSGDNYTVANRDAASLGGVKFYTGAAGLTTIAAMVATKWNDPYYMRIDMARNRKVDNFVSDGTGKSTGITDGILKASINLITTLTTNHKYTDFRNGTEISFGVTLDTGVLIAGSSPASNYRVDIIFPRCTITTVDLNIDGISTILPAVNLKPQKDPTAGYSVAFEVFNTTASYPDST